MKVSLLQNNIWQMQPRGRWQEISAPFRWFLRSAFPCQEAESLMQKNPAMPRETLGEFSKHNCMLFFNEPVFQAYFHAKTLSRAHRFRGYVTDSLGRALEWHSRGQRFDPAYLHHKHRGRCDEKVLKSYDFRTFSYISNLTKIRAGGMCVECRKKRWKHWKQ